MARARRALAWWRRSDKRVRLSAAVLAGVLFGWPATSALQALGFPVFEQVMLALSWLAPAITALDLLFTAQLHQRQDDRDAGDAGA
jgi:hypothetical protein